jgi:predicted O-methyltransferase YrrM
MATQINFTETDIETIFFENAFTAFFAQDDDDAQKTEFFGKIGKEHYRLLAYFSACFSDTTIIDIGTHRGSSALALSYNPNNTIYSFDIVDNVANAAIRRRENIRFLYDNLFDPTVRDTFAQIILNSSFIFLDVDPHNGEMEFEFYTWLKEHKYAGFVICDDIWYFKPMRDNFWYKTDPKHRYDLTDFGHWSGTGIISFNTKFAKNDNSNWTLVTAYFDLTKYDDATDEIKERDQTYYFSHAVSTLHLPYHLVVYCDTNSIDRIKQIRPETLPTRYIVCDLDDFFINAKTFKEYRKQIDDARAGNPYYANNRNTPSYYLFCMARYIMLKNTIQTNPFSSTHFAWINLCIERMGYKNLIRLDEALSIKRNKFSTCYIDYISPEVIANDAEYFQWGRCSMCSGFFTGNAYFMNLVCGLVEKKFIEYLDKGYGHADEQLYSPVYFETPHLFDHYYGDYTEMITNYAYVYENADAPIYNFIRNSFDDENYQKCLDACNYIMKSIFMKKCELAEEWFDALFYYYRESKKLNENPR